MSALWCRRLLLLALTVGAVAPASFAQMDRRERRDPAVVLRTGGRTGACDALMFTPDGKSLLATGDDHVVTIVDQTDKGLDPKSLHTLRWPSWREQRGAIYAMDISPNDNGKRVAIGGVGLRNSAVAILDRADGNVVHSTFLEKGNQNFLAVTAVRFSADGSRLAIGSGDGSIWVWEPGKSAVHLGTHERHEGQKANWVRLLAFEPAGTVLSLAQDGRLLRWRLDKPGTYDLVLDLEFRPKPNEDEAAARARAAALSPDGKWLAVTGTFSKVLLRSLDKTSNRDIKLSDNQFGRSVAFDPAGKHLAVGIGSSVRKGTFAIEADDKIGLYDIAAETPTSTATLAHSGRAERLAWHSNKNWLAVAGGDSHELTLWDLKDRGQPLPACRGLGTAIWSVTLSDNGDYLAFKDQRDPNGQHPNDRAKGDWRTFNLKKRQFEAKEPADFKPLAPLRTAGNWVVEGDAKKPYLWFAVHADGTRHVLAMDHARDDVPRCYTFLPDPAGTRVRLVVGHYWGATVYEVDKKGARRTHLLTGHQGEVTAVAPSADGTWLVTASNDQTISGWSLEPWPSGSTLGLKWKPGSLIVDSVDIGAPAWEMGLVKDDEIVLAAVDVSMIYKIDGTVEATDGRTTMRWEGKATGDVASTRRALEAPEPGVEVAFAVKRAGQEKCIPIKSTVRTRPLWRLFPSAEGEWVLWMWQGGYYDTSTYGDYLAGWEMNDATMTAAPRFIEMEKFRTQFHRPGIIEKLLETRDVEAALKDARGKNPLPLNFTGFEPPAVSMQLSAKEAADNVTVTLTASPRGENPDHLPQRAELWINDFRFQVWPLEGKKLSDKVTIQPRLLRSGANKLTFQVFNKLGGRVEVIDTLTNPKLPAKPKLLGLSVGINDYAASPEKSPDGTRNLLTNLESAVSDATKQRERWQAQSGKLYEKAEVTLKKNAEASPAAILKALDELREKAGPDDVIVLAFSGHGDFPNAAKAKGSTDDVFVFCGPDYVRARYRETGIDGQTLYERIVAIPGRKILILDACRSGDAVFCPVRALTPAGLGPIILTACDRSEFSYEHKKIGNGVFTYALLEAMEKADADDRGCLDAKALFDYAKKRMPEILESIREPGKPLPRQTPMMFPQQPERYPLIKR